MSFRRVIVVAPTRSTCVNLHYLVGLSELPMETLIQRECGDELKEAIAELPQGGFGIVANTGTGKSAAIRQICHEVMQKTNISVGIVTQEHRANDKIALRDVIVVTPGVTVMWAKNGSISSRDLIVLDEVHQTSEHLELAMAILKLSCTFVWMSATIDPKVYKEYLCARRVIECSAFDETRRAEVKYYRHQSVSEVVAELLPQLAASQRGMAVFVPTRELAQNLASKSNEGSGIHADFYHGGESAEKLRAYVEGEIPPPYVVFMTSAGASSLNIKGLTDVVISDEQYREVVQNGKRQRCKMVLDPNTILQMAGRVDGRAIGGRVHIVTNRSFDLRQLKPVTPSFVLGGDLELLAMTSARLGINLSDLSLIGGVDELAYQTTYQRLVSRGLIFVEGNSPSLTKLGQKVEALPTDVAWGEVIVKAQEVGDSDLLTVVCLAACVGELYGLTGKKWVKYADSRLVRGSDHLTGYNIVSQAIVSYGKKDSQGYKLSNKLKDLCKQYGYSQKEIRNVVLLFTSLLQRLGQKLPDTMDFPLVVANGSLHSRFIEVLAAVQSMSYVAAPTYKTFGNNRHGATTGFSVLGSLRHWKNGAGLLRSTIEGTHIPGEVVERYARDTILEIYGPGATPGTVEVYRHRTFADVDISGGGIIDVPMESLSPEVCNRFAPRLDVVRAAVRLAVEKSEKVASQLVQLRSEAEALRLKVNELLCTKNAMLNDNLFDRLDVLDIDDELLPKTVFGLQEWCKEAREALSAAAHWLNKTKSPAPKVAAAPSSGVSEAKLAELAEFFRR